MCHFHPLSRSIYEWMFTYDMQRRAPTLQLSGSGDDPVCVLGERNGAPVGMFVFINVDQ